MVFAGDPFGLDRFVAAQDGIFERALEELRAGRKRTHWMWFIFPQIAGLGSSEMAERYAIGSREEAVAYLGHNVLGKRLRLVTQAVNEVNGTSAEQIFGYPDFLKFRSSITLFAQVAPDEPIFEQALQKYFAGQHDPATLALLRV